MPKSVQATKKASSKIVSEPVPAQTDIDKTVYERNLFMVTVMNMTWQLAIVVIIPIVAGYYADRYFHTFPGLTIAGFVLAGLGVVGVMIRVVGEANRKLRGDK